MGDRYRVMKETDFKVLEPTKPKTAENITEFLKSEMGTLQTQAKTISQNAALIEATLNSLDAVALLSNLNSQLTAFTLQVQPLLQTIAASAQSETEFLTTLKDKLSKA
jgi:cell division protein ZapA (FtsZ GTPase activity inhibitor)